MLLNNRVLWKDSATLRDLSGSLNDLFAGTEVVDFVAADDKLYLGSDLPFNHRFFYVGSPNALASVAAVEIWNGNEWIPARDVQDQTAVAGATLAQSGILSWVTDWQTSWAQENTTEDMTGSGLEGQKIYNMYWVRISFSADLTSTTSLKYVGHRFSTDAMLAGYGYPHLNKANVKTAFEAGKTTWDDQHIVAAEMVIDALKRLHEITSPSQLVSWEILQEAAVHRVAEIIMVPFGDSSADARAEALRKFDRAIKGIRFPIDRNGDGHVDATERVSNAGLRRV